MRRQRARRQSSKRWVHNAAGLERAQQAPIGSWFANRTQGWGCLPAMLLQPYVTAFLKTGSQSGSARTYSSVQASTCSVLFLRVQAKAKPDRNNFKCPKCHRVGGCRITDNLGRPAVPPCLLTGCACCTLWYAPVQHTSPARPRGAMTHHIAPPALRARCRPTAAGGAPHRVAAAAVRHVPSVLPPGLPGPGARGPALGRLVLPQVRGQHAGGAAAGDGPGGAQAGRQRACGGAREGVTQRVWWAYDCTLCPAGIAAGAVSKAEAAGRKSASSPLLRCTLPASRA